MVACVALPVDGAVVVVSARGGGGVVATDPCGRLCGGARVLGGDGGGEEHRLEHSSLFSAVLAMLHVLCLAFLRVPLTHLLRPLEDLVSESPMIT